MYFKLAKVCYSYWKGISAFKKLSVAFKVPEDTAKKWLVKKVLWQIDLPARRRIPRLKFDVSTPSAVHHMDLIFLPHDKLPRGAKFSNTR